MDSSPIWTLHNPRYDFPISVHCTSPFANTLSFILATESIHHTTVKDLIIPFLYTSFTYLNIAQPKVWDFPMSVHTSTFSFKPLCIQDKNLLYRITYFQSLLSISFSSMQQKSTAAAIAHPHWSREYPTKKYSNIYYSHTSIHLNPAYVLTLSSGNRKVPHQLLHILPGIQKVPYQR